MRCFIELLSECEMLLGVLLTSALFPTGLHINGEWYGVDPQVAQTSPQPHPAIFKIYLIQGLPRRSRG